MLYIVPTPIGNLDDITLRALQVLKTVDLIIAEDTRTSGRLLKHFEITTPSRSYHAHNEHGITPQLIEQLQAGKTIALISDAGTPGISDPGFLLTRACVQAAIKVECLPGATAFVPALVASGLPCDRFHFEGFLPHKKGRQTRLIYLAALEHSFVLYESPHRLLKCLKQLAEFCGEDRLACVCRELTKLHEEVTTDTLAQLTVQYEARTKVKGEIVIVVSGKK
ncbi:MAG: 16S rRNA (cytidine(1402)-2'-O)-methyltransferase [Saprospiraceae bacterium]